MAVYGWILSDIFIEGLRRAGKCPSRQELIRNLRVVSGYTAGGLLPGAINFAEQDQIARCYSFVRFTPTAFQTIEPVNRCGQSVPMS